MLETGDKWAPTKKLVVVMDKIKSLMIVPNLDTPMNNNAATDFKNGQWEAKVKASIKNWLWLLWLEIFKKFVNEKLNRVHT